MDGCYDSAYLLRASCHHLGNWERGNGGAGETHIRGEREGASFCICGRGRGSGEENPHMLAFGVKGMCVTCVCGMGRGRGRPGRG